MSATVVILGMSLAALMAAGTIVNYVMTIMIGEINRKRGENNVVSYWGSTPLKVIGILTEYRKAYPDGRLHLYCLVALSAFGASGLVIFGVLAAEWIAVNRTP